jgi:hypothetical protein
MAIAVNGFTQKHHSPKSYNSVRGKSANTFLELNQIFKELG